MSFFFLSVLLCAAQIEPGQAKPAINPAIVTAQPASGGIPLGGIGTGTFRLHPDGSFGQATLTNNRAFPLRTLNGCFAALWTKNEGGTQANTLNLANAYGLPAVSALEYEGLFPQANLSYRLASPVLLTLTAFSPLIPHDLRNSTRPGAVFVYHVKNTTERPVEVAIAFSWENFLGVGGMKHTDAFANRTGNKVQNLPDSEGVFGLRLISPPISTSSFRANASGEMALVCLPPRSQAQVTFGGWNSFDKHPAWWDKFANEGTVGGSFPVGIEGQVHPAGVVAVKFTLRAKESLDLPFVVAWHTPHFVSQIGGDYGHYYQAAAEDAATTARYLAREWRPLHALTEEWQNRIVFSNLPHPAAKRVINALAPLTANTLYTRDERLVFFSEAEAYGGTSASLTESHAIFPMLLAFFPRLAAQHLRQFAALQAPSGLLPITLGDTEKSLEVPNANPALPSPPNTTEPPRTLEVFLANAAFLLEMTQFVQQTGDREFLKTLYPQIKRCAEALKTVNLPQDNFGKTILQVYAAMAWMAATTGDSETAVRYEQDARSYTVRIRYVQPIGERILGLPTVDRLLTESTLFLTSASDSNLITELSGMKWDAINGVLTLAPDIPGTWRNFSAPVFLPSAWGKLDYKPTARGGTTTLRMDRLIPLPAFLSTKPAAGRPEFLIKQWRLGDNAPVRPETDRAVFVSLGQNPIGYKAEYPSAFYSIRLMTLSFEMAVRLNAGDRLEAVLR